MRMLFPICLSLLLSIGCRVAGGDSPPLQYAQPSAEVLAGKVLEALAQRDDQGLKDLVITKEEFCRYVWPELPSSKTPNLTCDWVWNAFEPGDIAGRRQIMARHGGKQCSLIRLRSARGITEYKSFRVHEDVRVTVRDSAGKEEELKLFGSILEYGGQFKLFSYIVD
jgi:hypothetical protein